MLESKTEAITKPNINIKHSWFRLSKERSIYLLIYLTFIALTSFIILTIILIDEINPFISFSIFSQSIICAIVASSLGAGIYFSRKLYKACISRDMLPPTDEDDKIRQVGITAYYLTRPIYSIGLSLITCIAIKSGSEFISTNGVLNEKYTYLVIIISFFVGYSSSDFIDDLEMKGKNILNGVINLKNK